MTVKQYLGRQIRLARKRKGLSQEELGRIVGLSNQAVCRWERGRNEPCSEHIVALCKALDVSSDHLLGLDKADSE